MITNPAAPVTALTEDQAVEELAAILDAAPPEEDQLARIRWGQEHAQRAQQLEQHIVHLHQVAGAAETPAPTPGIVTPQIAPPPALAA